MSKGRSKNKAKRSPASLPKGLPHRKQQQQLKNGTTPLNPFEYKTTSRRPKHDVLNRRLPGVNTNSSRTSALARSIERRKLSLKESLRQSSKSNQFHDRRIGAKEDGMMNEEEVHIARLVKERVKRSKRSAVFDLNNDEDENRSLGMTHLGKAIDENYKSRADEVFENDDDDDDDENANYYKQKGALDRADTEMHFGGGAFNRINSADGNTYGNNNNSQINIGDAYRSRKEEMDDMIKRKKLIKVEKQKSKEMQVDKFEELDGSFKELAALLSFRNKNDEFKIEQAKREQGTQDAMNKEMDDWEKDVKSYQFERKVAATDRTKPPEEIAKEEADRLHELETRRLARMNGDFEDDDLSDVDSVDDISSFKKKKKIPKTPEDLDDGEDDDDENEGNRQQFTSDGMVTLDKHGNIIQDDDDDDDDDDTASTSSSVEQHKDSILTVGTKVQGNYHAEEQFDKHAAWYTGVVTKVHEDNFGNCVNRYDVTYDDGDFEEGMKRKHIKLLHDTMKEDKKQQLQEEQTEKVMLTKKRKRAREMARSSIPFVFEVPTTLDALHDVIATHATTGSDASLIVERIFLSNRIKLDHNNREKMQNFYDVVLRRFILIGDALYEHGDGGDDNENNVNRYNQLEALTQILYKMAQDCANMAAAVWTRRINIFQKALGKRLRDAELVMTDNTNNNNDEEDTSAWPSMGTILLLKTVGHIFPVTDLRHAVVTPTLLLLGQILSQTPVQSNDDVCKGLLCTGLLLEYTRVAQRWVPETASFLAGVLRLFGKQVDCKLSPMPSLEYAATVLSEDLREALVSYKENDDRSLPRLSLERDYYQQDKTLLATAIFCTTLQLVQRCAIIYQDALQGAEPEAFFQLNNSLTCLFHKKSNKPLSSPQLSTLLDKTRQVLHHTCAPRDRTPLSRKTSLTKTLSSIPSFAPRVDVSSKYVITNKDKNKTQNQAQADRMRREYKREHKAVTRELKLDAAFVEKERRQSQMERDGRERQKRNKNFSWMEQEQATMNQQIRLGGGLMKGGGIGAAKRKVESAQMGIKKGGKFKSS